MSKKSFFGSLKKSKEAESKPPRPLDEIKTEFSQVCGIFGDLELKRRALKLDQDRYFTRYLQLHEEANKAEALAKASAAVPAVPPEVITE